MNIPTKENPFKVIVRGTPVSWNQTTAHKVAERRVKGKVIRYVDTYPSERGLAWKRKISSAIKLQLRKWEKENGKWDKEETKNGFWRVHIDYVLHTRATDPNNQWKTTLDGIIQSTLIHDDNNCKAEDGMVLYNPDDPMIIVKIWKDSQVGIWQNETHKELWMGKNCDKCKKTRCALKTSYLKGESKGIDLFNGYSCTGFIEKNYK